MLLEYSYLNSLNSTHYRFLTLRKPAWWLLELAYTSTWRPLLAKTEAIKAAFAGTVHTPESTRNKLEWKNQFFWSSRLLLQGKFDTHRFGLQEYSYDILTQANLSSTCPLVPLGLPENLN